LANTNAPFGFRYFGRLEGGSPTEGLSYRSIASTYGSAIYQGDPVLSLNTGYISLPSVSTTQVTGIFYNLRYYNSNVAQTIQGAPYWPSSGAGGNGTAGICDDPNAMFLVQSNGTPITFADIGSNIGWASGSGSTLTGISGYSVDQSTIGTSSALPFRIVGLASQFLPPGSPGTDDTANYNQVVVTFNATDRHGGTTGV